MESDSIRTCEREGCGGDLDALGLKRTARFCSPTCGREHRRAEGDGDERRKWIKGHWRAKNPRRRPQPRRAVGSRHHSLGINSQSGVLSPGRSAAQAGR